MMLKNHIREWLMVTLFAAVSAFSPLPQSPFQKYKECAESRPSSPDQAFHQEHGCLSFFIGLGILGDLIPMPSELRQPESKGNSGPPPNPSPSPSPIPSERREKSGESAGGFIGMPMEGMFPPQDIASRRIGLAMTSAFSFGGDRKKRGTGLRVGDQVWMKKDVLTNGWMRNGKKRNSRMPTSRLQNVPGIAPPLFGMLPPPMAPVFAPQRPTNPNFLEFDQKSIDKQICTLFREYAAKVIESGSVGSMCCDLSCYCDELEQNSTEVCGGHWHPFYTNPPTPPIFPSGEFGPPSMMGGFPLPFNPPPMPTGPENFTIPVSEKPTERKVVGEEKPTKIQKLGGYKSYKTTKP